MKSFRSNPTGGPWSSPWSNGNPPPQAAPTSSAAQPCLNPADVFSDCFLGCSGTLSLQDPGQVCGWTWSTSFDSDAGGQADLSEGSLALVLSDMDHGPAVQKTIPADLDDVFDLTAQWVFDQLAGSAATYILLFTAKDNAQQLYLQISAGPGFGNVVIEVGDTGSQAFYFGEWTATPGKQTTVSISTSEAGVPTLYIDGGLIPLVFQFNSGGRPDFAGNSIFLNLSNDQPAEFVTRKIFLAEGQRATETFCCG